jgi:hypothetical protein
MTRSKYGAKKTEVDGYVFDSRAEARHYSDLKLREMAGEITLLALQPRFELIVNDKKIGTYVADFSYTENGNRIVVDVKGMRTPVYRLKKKLMYAIYGIEIQEVA